MGLRKVDLAARKRQTAVFTEGALVIRSIKVI